jgi:D-3-phosphoglycerate dehydrogenase
LIAGLDEIDASVFEAAPRLRVVARYGVGTSNVDLQAAERHGVIVTNTPGANAEAVAELAIGFIFALARTIPAMDRAVHVGGWPSVRGFEVRGRTVGILGLGRIGLAVARRAIGLGCAVRAYDPYVDARTVKELEIQLGPLDDVVAGADFLSLHLPLTAETHGMVNRDLLQRLPRGAYLINTARGELLVDDDVLWALDSGHLRGAALDTLSEEPPSPDHPFLTRQDIILTPHMGAHTVDAALAMGRMALNDLLAVLSGKAACHVVDLTSH